MNGIYQIKNLINNKVYVGSSNNINKRWGQHIYHLNAGTHHSKHLQAAWDKYSKENFAFSILEEVNTSDNIFIKEKDWIIRLNSIDSNYGYNAGIPNESGNTPMTKEGKEKCILAIIKRARNIIMLEKETGKFIGEYESSGLIVKEYGFPNNKKVHEVLLKQRVAYKGYIFIYKEEYDETKDNSSPRDSQYAQIRKPVFQYDMNMKFIKEWDNAQQIVDELNMKLSSIYTAINREQYLFGSYWRRERI